MRNFMKSSYSIVKINPELNYVLIRDCNGTMSITNDAEKVVEHLMSVMRKKLSLTLDDVPSHDIYYIDSTGMIDKLEKNYFGELSDIVICNYPNIEFLESALIQIKGM